MTHHDLSHKMILQFKTQPTNLCSLVQNALSTSEAQLSYEHNVEPWQEINVTNRTNRRTQ